MAVRRSCVKCDKPLRFDASHRRNRKYCRRCAKEVKREYDRQYKQDYRAKPAGKEQRQRESHKRRARLGWSDYMRYWRKADSWRVAAQERARAKRYYARHRAQILAKRRAQRAARKAARQACSH
jgi:hypothetical protein